MAFRIADNNFLGRTTINGGLPFGGTTNQISIRFTLQDVGTGVATINTVLASFTNVPLGGVAACRVYTNNPSSGFPSAPVFGPSNSVSLVNGTNVFSWTGSFIPALTPGQVYHLVFGATAGAGIDVLGQRDQHQPRDYSIDTYTFNDPQMSLCVQNTSLNWTNDTTHTPLFLVNLTPQAGGASYTVGQYNTGPYANVRGNTYIGEFFTLPNEVTTNKLGFYLSSNVTPASNAEWEIIDNSQLVLASGTLVTPTGVSSNIAPIMINIEPFTFKAGVQYGIVLKAPGEVANSYHVVQSTMLPAAWTLIHSDPTFGGTLNFGAFSIDGGVTWNPIKTNLTDGDYPVIADLAQSVITDVVVNGTSIYDGVTRTNFVGTEGDPLVVEAALMNMSDKSEIYKIVMIDSTLNPGPYGGNADTMPGVMAETARFTTPPGSVSVLQELVPIAWDGLLPQGNFSPVFLAVHLE